MEVRAILYPFAAVILAGASTSSQQTPFSDLVLLCGHKVFNLERSSGAGSRPGSGRAGSEGRVGSRAGSAVGIYTTGLYGSCGSSFKQPLNRMTLP